MFQSANPQGSVLGDEEIGVDVVDTKLNAEIKLLPCAAVEQTQAAMTLLAGDDQISAVFDQAGEFSLSKS
ncbi:MAG: hypothetical protein BWY83_02154 [bacterium ADurb.Bin478]|nr:MAG: hypothetical protein BWY83_02154 [bacterium ADurb.Bin478]